MALSVRVVLSRFGTVYGLLVPRFYFHLCNGLEFAEDQEGVDLADYAAAHRNAVLSLRGVMSGDLLKGDVNTASFIEVKDGQHNLIETVSFADVVTLRNAPHRRQTHRA
jgi:hypothetical protein